jgi:hypothetical protein
MPSNDDKPVPRILQQQPARETDAQQQESGSDDLQPEATGASGDRQQMGEGSYEATRDYQKNIKEYMKKADVEADAQKARPRSDQEARELQDAEKEGRSHSKGER